MPRGRPRTQPVSEVNSTNKLGLAGEISHDQIRQLAGNRSFSAGEDYFQRGTVRSLAVLGEKVTATVQGSERYRVTLEAKTHGLDYNCTCPWYEDTGEFCKHCVAVALTYQSQHLETQIIEVSTDAPVNVSDKRRIRGATLDPVKLWLESLPREDLIALLLDQAINNEEFQKRLQIRVAANPGGKVDMAGLRRAIKKAIQIEEYLDYHEVRGYVGEIEEVLDTLEDLVKRGHGKAVKELAEFAISLLEEAQEEIDDSDGYLGEIISRVIEIHRDACVQSRPDPRTLAQDLYKRAVNDDYDFWSDVLEVYEDALGTVGKAEFDRILRKDWEAFPQLSAGEGGSSRWESRRFRITSLMKSSARIAKDTDALVTILKKDLSAAYCYLEIAQVLREAERHDEAFTWAEKGVAVFGADADSRLIDFLIEEYKRRGIHDKALEVLWARYEKAPGLATFRALHDYTEPIHGWPTWRENAVHLLQQRITDEKRKPKETAPLFFRLEPIATRLIEIFLWEKEIDAAWELARQEGTTNSLWRQLALASEEKRPGDAIAVYQRLIPPLIEPVTNGQYSDPVTLIERVRDVMHRQNRRDEFKEYVADLRTTFKRKRNFLALLEQKGM